MDGPGYVVESRLGRGGMGVVDLAVAPDGSRVALKRIALHGSADALAAARARIRREAEVLGRLDHRRIVGLLDVVDDGDDVVLVMPWMRGGSLADRVAGGGPLPAQEVTRLADHLLGALAAAHRAGVVHRDIKPANILFDEQSRPHLADFGVATARDVTAGLTVAGGAVGTAGFLAPEQARGEVAGPAADVFSLGASLRWAVTGTGPYGEGSRDVLLWRASRAKVDPCPRTVPEPLRSRIDAMLDPRPWRRPTAAALAGGPDGTEEARPGRRRAQPSRRLALAAGGGAAALILAVVGALAIGGSDGDDGDGEAAAGDGGTTCVPLPFQPCGQPAAPGTDGRSCIEDRADYDGDAANGCEAIPDELDGTPLGSVEATIVPADDTDEFPVEVADNFHLTCDGHITFDLTAPAGMALRLEVRQGDDLLAETTSADGVAARLRIDEPQCAGDDSTTLTAVVRPIGSDRSAEPYRLARSGNW
jgi:hypothetical protein